MVSSQNNDHRNGHVLVESQQTRLNSDNEAHHPTPKGFGTRHYVTFMLFLGMANAYIMRTNMSVAIVAMVNHTAIHPDPEIFDNECPDTDYGNHSEHQQNGEFEWTTSKQGWILSSFFYGYVLTQIPFGILAKKYGSLGFLGWGMFINSVFGFLVPISAHWGVGWLIIVRFIQGLGEGPIVPCTHALLAKWIPPQERSRMGAIVYAGAQFGTIISMPISGLLAEHSWPSIFYVFGFIGVVWSLAFLWTVYEDPTSNPKMKIEEKKYINQALWGNGTTDKSPTIPWKSIAKSMPFYAILFAHMAQNYGYEFLMTELPTYMKQVLRFSIKENGFLSSVPYLGMWIASILLSMIADWLISTEKASITVTRKIFNVIGQFGPAICLAAVSFTGCNRVLTVFLLTVGISLNGGIYSGFKINHLDISPRFAGILMAISNCSANLAGLLAPITAGYLIDGNPTIAQWQIVFFIASAVYVICATFYIFFGSGERQEWDNPDNDHLHKNESVPNETNRMLQTDKN
ncbi:CLUMA_CG002510, isoform A [Clunio marinus]|uniref:Putative inorganic phosphate cotransporter n=1 Tax=Clunio marinus TaxID=568069 RepID=A0A1J1HM50_9DIPT|nr:CLUMA_CG002510, isoform A [Clunio marinus]